MKVEKYRINANKDQLNGFGIDCDINGLIGEIKHKYSTGWYAIEITHTYDSVTFTNIFDIPKTFLQRIY
jgi:hypothetical protein